MNSQKLTSARIRELGAIFFRIGGLTFGGGNAGIAAIHRELVTKRGWLNQPQFQFCYALARVAPGTNLLAFCVAVGWSLLGWPGALLAVVSLSVPSALLVILFTHAYEAWHMYPLAQSVIRGLLAATIGIIVASAWVLMRPALTYNKWLRPVVIVTGAMLLTLFYSVSPLRVLALAALVGLIWRDREK
ncbi:MAG TPA: chromate transporter [Blastocatellia bacterium]|nr:chromate transporter [Blastocatellia bacterium]